MFCTLKQVWLTQAHPFAFELYPEGLCISMYVNFKLIKLSLILLLATREGLAIRRVQSVQCSL